MVYVTGDTHGDFDRIVWFAQENNDLTKDDYLIICGDFGGVWYRKDYVYNGNFYESEQKSLDMLNELPFTILFVDGNHENHVNIADYPVKEWHGGKVHEIRPSVLHLMRGEVFNICGKKFFCFGGASSHDIRDGILNPDEYENWEEEAIRWDRNFKQFRIKGFSWWEEELPTNEEMDNGIKNLQRDGWKTDFVITHSPPATVIALVGYGLYEQDVLTNYLEDIRVDLDYQKWYMGHIHLDKAINAKEIILYHTIKRIV